MNDVAGGAKTSVAEHPLIAQSEAPRDGSDAESHLVQHALDATESQIAAAGNLTPAQIAAIRNFQRRKGMAFAEAAIALGLVHRDSLFLALSKRYRYPVLTLDGNGGQFSRELVVGFQPFHPRSEAFRSIRGALIARAFHNDQHAFAIIGPRPASGATYLAANLALAFAQMSVRTLLVDANLRRPRIASLFGLGKNIDGLTEALNLGVVDPPPIVADVVPGLSILGSGALAPNPQELLSSQGFVALSNRARRDYEAVIYDVPSALENADAYIVASRVGSAIIAARRHKTTFADVAKVSESLRDFRCEIVGSVLDQF